MHEHGHTSLFPYTRLSSQRVCAEFLWASIVTLISFDDVDYVSGFHSSSPMWWRVMGKPPKWRKYRNPSVYLSCCQQ